MSDINTNMQISGSYHTMVGEPPTVEETKGVKHQTTDKGVDITCAEKPGPSVPVSVPELEVPKNGNKVDAPALLNKMRDVGKPFTLPKFGGPAQGPTLRGPAPGPTLRDPAPGPAPSGHTCTSIYAIIQLLFEVGVELRKAAWKSKNASDMQQVSTILGQAEQQRQNALTGVSAAFASMGLQVAAMALPSLVQGLSANKAEAAKAAIGTDAYKQMSDNAKLEGDLPKASDDVSVAETKLDGLLTSSNKSGTSDPALEQIGDLGFTKKDIVEAVSGFDDKGNVRLKSSQESLKNSIQRAKNDLKVTQDQLAQARTNSPADVPKLEMDMLKGETRVKLLEAKQKTAEAATALKTAATDLKNAKMDPNVSDYKVQKEKYETAQGNYREAVQNGFEVIEGRFGEVNGGYLKKLDDSTFGYHGFSKLGNTSKWLGGRNELGKSADQVNQVKQATVFAHALKTKEFSKTIADQPLSSSVDRRMGVGDAKQNLSAAKERLNDADVYTNNLERVQTSRTWRDGLTMAMRCLDQVVQYGVHSMEADVTARGAQAKMEEIKSDTSKRMLDDAAQLCQRAIQLYDMAQQSELSVIQKVVA